jgi:hypothetical protein
VGKFTGLDGRAILKQAQTEIYRAGTEMSLTAEYDHLPSEHRARVRAERTNTVRVVRAESRQAIDDWATAERADAQKHLNANPVGTAAEESRRVAEELRIGRMVETARASGNPKSAADDIAERASKAYGVGNGDEAHVLARASVELNGPSYATEIVKNVELDRTLADPEKAKALKDLGDVEVVLAAFHRDINASVAQALQDSVKLAEAIGDKSAAMDLKRETVEASMTAKGAAYDLASRTGTRYVSPPGVLSEGPTDYSHPIRSIHAASEGGDA